MSVGTRVRAPSENARGTGGGPTAAVSSLRLSEAELAQATVSGSPIALMVVDGARKVRLWNPAAEQLFGWSAPEVVGQPIPIVSDDQRPQGDEHLRRALSGERIVGVELQRQHRDGRPREVVLSTVPLHDSDGTIVACLAAYQDIGARKAAEAALLRQALTDEVTGLVNRRGLLGRLGEELSQRSCRSVVVILNLDHFKNVNDVFGHRVGDQILALFAERLRESVGARDLVARLEGGSFGILLEGISSVGLEAALAKLFVKVTGRFTVEGHEIAVQVTGGVALCSPHDDPSEVLRRADVALGYAKRKTRGGFQVLDEALDQEFLDRTALSISLMAAPARGQLRLHFQPITGSDTGQIVGMEALVRWQHPQRGLLGPDQFISLAEENGSISEIGRWVLQEACTNLRRWEETTPAAAGLRVSVNLSVAQLYDMRLAHDVRLALRDSGLKPERLQLEVTESVLSADPASAAAALGRLRDLGVRLAIDDFGTGNSSLTALQRFPFQALKIDRSFVSGIGVRPGDTTIVNATLALAHGLGLSVVAEGVETLSQAAFLAQNDCEELQGYLFGRPLRSGQVRLRLARPHQPGRRALAAPR